MTTLKQPAAELSLKQNYCCDNGNFGDGHLCQKQPAAKGDGELFEKALFALTRIIHDLPANKDWLDPDIEAIARQAIDAAMNQTKRSEDE